ncbi:hypothetical protein [Embleya sp. MST-111070]|uniref:hypothetical protein n=1 Tax=Embleya sp. MST-111070 TaxID=3398231 RepID=UPI003F73A10B
MPTTQHEELRAAIVRAREVLAAHPNDPPAPELATLIGAAEPFANFTQAVPPPQPRPMATEVTEVTGTVVPDGTGP